MNTLTVKRPQKASLPMVAFIESVIDEINNEGLNRNLSIDYHGKSLWVRYATVKTDKGWHRLTARITEGAKGLIIAFNEERAKVEEAREGKLC